MQYTSVTLEAINASYLADHSINQKDVEKVNTLATQIEEGRQGTLTPLPGDIVVIVSPEGEVLSKNGHIEQETDNGKLSVCSSPYVSFVLNGPRYNTSGGPWFATCPDELQYTGKQDKTFKTWGHFGPDRNGAVYFQAEVNAWRIVRTHR